MLVRRSRSDCAIPWRNSSARACVIRYCRSFLIIYLAPTSVATSCEHRKVYDDDTDRLIVSRVLEELHKRSACEPFNEPCGKEFSTNRCFCAARSSSKSKKTGSSASASTPSISHATFMSFGSLLAVTKLPPTKTRAQPALRRKSNVASSLESCCRR